jgi:hypothetical protein
MSKTLPTGPEARIEHLVSELDSLMDGDLASAGLLECGQPAIPYLQDFLLAGSPRTIAMPRCRAVHILGKLGAQSVLISYFVEYKQPYDPAVLFAEDAVRSAVARELLHWRSEDVFCVLLRAARQRATADLIFALGEFRRSSTVSLLFEVLEDDLCREEAKNALRKIRDTAFDYAFLTIRGVTGAQFYGPSALLRRRAILQLLEEFGVPPSRWSEIRPFLDELDAGVVIAAANIGLAAGPDSDQAQIVESLFRIGDHVNWVQEDQVIMLLDTRQAIAKDVGRGLANERKARAERLNWLKPSWRILRHVLGKELEGECHGAA